jgi:hypothetical protein
MQMGEEVEKTNQIIITYEMQVSKLIIMISNSLKNVEFQRVLYLVHPCCIQRCTFSAVNFYISIICIILKK